MIRNFKRGILIVIIGATLLYPAFQLRHVGAPVCRRWLQKCVIKLPSNLWYKPYLNKHQNCRSLRCSWSIACRRWSNYIFVIDLTPGFNRLRKDNLKTRQETFKFWDSVWLILETWRYSVLVHICRAGTSINSLAPGRPGCHFKTAIFNPVLLIAIFTSSNDDALRWMPWDLIDDKSTLVHVMAWCRQETSHYLSQCWPSSMSPYGVTRPQWVKDLMSSAHQTWFRKLNFFRAIVLQWIGFDDFVPTCINGNHT